MREQNKRSPCFKEGRRCASGVEGKFPFPSSHITFPFFSSHLLPCAVSLPYASLIKGKGVSERERRGVLGRKENWEGVRRMMKGGGGGVVEAERTGKR